MSAAGTGTLTARKVGERNVNLCNPREICD
jgi:hypothetical protein